MLAAQQHQFWLYNRRPGTCFLSLCRVEDHLSSCRYRQVFHFPTDTLDSSRLAATYISHFRRLLLLFLSGTLMILS